MNLEGKKTVLEDDASIYQQRKDESEKQKLGKMDGRQKLQYFRDYYLAKVVVGLVLLGFVGAVVYTMVKPKPETVLYVAVVDMQLEEDAREALIEELNQLYNIDGEKSQVFFDDTIFLEQHGYEKLQVLLFNQQADVIIASQETYEALAGNGFFQSMDNLPGELAAKYEDSYVYTPGFQEEDEEAKVEAASGKGESLPYGVSLSESEKFHQLAPNFAQPVLGVLAASPHPENAVQFLDYLMEIE